MKLIPVDELWNCKTCFYNGPCGCTTYCDAGEGYRPAYTKLTIYEVSEEVLYNAKAED